MPALSAAVLIGVWSNEFTSPQHGTLLRAFGYSVTLVTILLMFTLGSHSLRGVLEVLDPALLLRESPLTPQLGWTRYECGWGEYRPPMAVFPRDRPIPIKRGTPARRNQGPHIEATRPTGDTYSLDGRIVADLPLLEQRNGGAWASSSLQHRCGIRATYWWRAESIHGPMFSGYSA